MPNDQLRRLEKLEQAINPQGRVVGFWDDGTDVDLQVARFRAERGLSEADKVIAFRWRSSAERNADGGFVMAPDHRRRIEKLESAANLANRPPPMIIIRIVERIDGELVVSDQFRIGDNGHPVLTIATGVPRHPSHRREPYAIPRHPL